VKATDGRITQKLQDAAKHLADAAKALGEAAEQLTDPPVKRLGRRDKPEVLKPEGREAKILAEEASDIRVRVKALHSRLDA
jgi:hypothetical protein